MGVEAGVHEMTSEQYGALYTSPITVDDVREEWRAAHKETSSFRMALPRTVTRTASGAIIKQPMSRREMYNLCVELRSIAQNPEDPRFKGGDFYIDTEHHVDDKFSLVVTREHSKPHIHARDLHDAILLFGEAPPTTYQIAIFALALALAVCFIGTLFTAATLIDYSIALNKFDVSVAGSAAPSMPFSTMVMHRILGALLVVISGLVTCIHFVKRAGWATPNGSHANVRRWVVKKLTESV